jgi:hypothetical protein
MHIENFGQMDFDERDGDFDMQIIIVQKDRKVSTN